MRTKRIMIVGGGSAGWTAAAYLNAALNVDNHPIVDISVVESPDVPRIGVGEATVPNIHHILSVIGINELDFMKAVDATFKQSIRYVDWLDNKPLIDPQNNTPNNSKNKRKAYHHPFCRYGAGPADDAGRRWLQSDRSLPFMNTVSAQPIICEMGLSPKMLDNKDSGIPLTYAFHMNALKYADYLCELATARGVTHHREHVTNIEVAESGNIAALQTRSGMRLEADLFIDCTGFAALLIEKTLGVKWVDCSQWLLCDRALVMPVPYEDHYPGVVRPYTMSTAKSAGWIWDIPLLNRRGLGYVHSSAHISKEQAERELRAYEGAHAKDLDARFVNFKVGMREKAWFKNCIAIGLSGGFLEPLESTGLYLSELATTMLAEHFPYTDEMEPLAFRFNRIMENRFYEILDFLNMHYCLSRRTDTEFWREVQRPERINDRLKAKLEFWRLKPPSVSDFQDQFFSGQPKIHSPASNAGEWGLGDNRYPVDTGTLWNHHSYENILYGMDFLRDEYLQRYGENRSRPSVLQEVLDAVNSAPGKLPPHDVWLRKMVGMAHYETSGVSA